MYNSLLIVIILSFFINSCSFKNPLSKNSQVVYVDCPRTLILSPASKIIKEEITLNLNKNYSMNCYTVSQSPTDVIVEYNFTIDVSYKEVNHNNITNEFELIIFATDEKEEEKLFEESFPNIIQTEFNSGQNKSDITEKSEFIEKIKLEKVFYEKGLKLFIGII